MRESCLERQCRQAAVARDCLFVKLISPGRRGWPDRMVLVPQRWRHPAPAQVWFVELKKSGEKPNRAQAQVLQDLSQKGFHATWHDDLPSFVRMLVHLTTVEDR